MNELETRIAKLQRSFIIWRTFIAAGALAATWLGISAHSIQKQLDQNSRDIASNTTQIGINTTNLDNFTKQWETQIVERQKLALHEISVSAQPIAKQVVSAELSELQTHISNQQWTPGTPAKNDANGTHTDAFCPAGGYLAGLSIDWGSKCKDCDADTVKTVTPLCRPLFVDNGGK